MLYRYLSRPFCALRLPMSRQSAQQRNRNEYEFLPGYLEIVERPPSAWARRTALAITVLLVSALVWAIVGKLDIHAVATGRVIVSSHSKVIQSYEQGEISAIKVRDGQYVEAGDILISLNPIGADAEVRRLREQLNYNRLQKARLQALLLPSPEGSFVAPEGIDPSLVKGTRFQLLAEWNEIQAYLQSIDAEVEVNQASQRAAQRQFEALKRLHTNANTRLAAREKLVKTQSISRVELLEKQQELLEIEKEQTRVRAEFDVLKAESQSLAEQRDTYLSQKRRENYEKLNQVESQLVQLEQELIKAQERQRQQNLRAPVAGVVQQLAVHTIGGVVQPAQQLMVIVPENAPLEAEVRVLNKDIGFVVAGQGAEIKVDAFPYTRYGTIPAILEYVSLDAVQDEQLGLVFPARVRLARDVIDVDGDRVRLQAGMSVTAEIKTGDRHIIDYLLSPLQQYQSEALRER